MLPLIAAMARLRVLLAALLLVAFTLGTSTHAATIHGLTHEGAPTVTHVHDQGHGKGECCPEGHKLSSHKVCQLACSSALAVLDGPLQLSARIAYSTHFAAGLPTALRDVLRAPDPFPPRPDRIA